MNTKQALHLGPLRNGQRFEYCAYSNTVRLMPQNYLVLYDKLGNASACHWVPDFDGAISKGLALAVVRLLVAENRMNKFKKGPELAALLNTSLQ